MAEASVIAPEPTAARVALWRALHLEADAPPPVLADRVGLQLLAPAEGWRERPDMNAQATRLFRASIIARARYIEDLVAEQAGHGLGQYVILGAGLDSFAQREREVASKLRVFEIDRPGPQEWKRRRLIELGFGIPDGLRFVPVDFEAGDNWRDGLKAAGFDAQKPAVLAATGLSMYLTKEANFALLREVAAFAPGSRLVFSFLLPIESVSADVRTGFEFAERGARESGTPFLSYFHPEEIMALAREAGFGTVGYLSGAELGERYFAGRTDGLRPPARAEELLVAIV